MNITNENRPAFPISEEETDRIEEGVYIYTGLTKLEYFAGQAMKGFCANPSLVDWDEKQTSNTALEHADALLKALQS